MKDFTINHLTKIPGGYFLKIEFTDGSKSTSINTKSPYKYIMKVITETALEGKTVKSVYTSSDVLVYENGKFNPEFIPKGNKSTF
jgi:hypothetical protein